MAASSSSSWVKGFSGSPDEWEPLDEWVDLGVDARGEASGREATLAEVLRMIGDETLAYPLDDPNAPVMSRRELLGRVLWTRAIVDGDMTAIKVLLECLGKSDGGDDGMGPYRVDITADVLAEAERRLKAWEMEMAAQSFIAGQAEEATGGKKH